MADETVEIDGISCIDRNGDVYFRACEFTRTVLAPADKTLGSPLTRMFADTISGKAFKIPGGGKRGWYFPVGEMSSFGTFLTNAENKKKAVSSICRAANSRRNTAPAPWVQSAPPVVPAEDPHIQLMENAFFASRTPVRVS